VAAHGDDDSWLLQVAASSQQQQQQHAAACSRLERWSCLQVGGEATHGKRPQCTAALTAWLPAPRTLLRRPPQPPAQPALPERVAALAARVLSTQPPAPLRGPRLGWMGAGPATRPPTPAHRPRAPLATCCPAGVQFKRSGRPASSGWTPHSDHTQLQLRGSEDEPHEGTEMAQARDKLHAVCQCGGPAAGACYLLMRACTGLLPAGARAPATCVLPPMGLQLHPLLTRLPACLPPPPLALPLLAGQASGDPAASVAPCPRVVAGRTLGRQHAATPLMGHLGPAGRYTRGLGW
jgi:hypothetical protein